MILLVWYNDREKKKHFQFTVIMVLLSLFGACAYLFSCIPTPMSYFSSTIVLLCAVCYLYLNISINLKQKIALSVTAMMITLYHFVPAGIEAWHYKPYEKIRFCEIEQQKMQGIKNVVLPASYPSIPKDPLGLIRMSDLKENPDQYPNPMAADVYQVETISQLPCKK